MPSGWGVYLAGAMFVLVVLVVWVPKAWSSGIWNLDERTKLRWEIRRFLMQSAAGAFLVWTAYSAYNTMRITERGQVNERFVRATEILSNLSTATGGIFSLEQIASDARETHRTPVVELLCSYLRRNSPLIPATDALLVNPPDSLKVRHDIQNAINVLGRRDTTGEAHGMDLTFTYFANASFLGAQLARANLRGSDLRRANLIKADLRSTNLIGTVFRGADFRETKLHDARFLNTDFRGADNLTVEQLLEARNPYDAKFDDSLAVTLKMLLQKELSELMRRATEEEDKQAMERLRVRFHLDWPPRESLVSPFKVRIIPQSD